MLIFKKLMSVVLWAVLLLLFAVPSSAEVIPVENVGEGNWVTLKTENGYYFYAIEEGGQVKLGQTQVAPNSENYAKYCWQIEGDAVAGYTFRCLRYENTGKKYITNPSSLVTNSAEVLLSDTPSKYFYTSNHQLQLVDNTNLYLAFYSQWYHTIRLHNSSNYVGSKMIIGKVDEWSVAAVVYGSETIGEDGLPQGTYLPNGGITFNGNNYTHGSSITLDNPSQSYTQLAIDGYRGTSIKIDEENRYIVSYYVGNASQYTYSNAVVPVPQDGNAVTGANNTIWALDAKNYITNTSGNYTNVPADKAWQMEMVVQNTTTSGQNDPSFNQYGSCILSSCGDPLNTYYWGNFQVYQHSPNHTSPNTLNFKSSKGDGNDHIIAQGTSVKNKNYKVIVRYAGGGNVYLIRTIMLDNELNDTQEVYNNVWVSARQQVAITQMSCALPTGINLKRLRISIAEDCGLLEGVDYAIQNLGNKHYVSIGDDQSFQHYRTADHASKFQIEYTGNNDLAYHDGDGGLHSTIYLIVEVWDTQQKKVVKKYVGPKTEGAWTLVDYDDEYKSQAQPFLFSPTSKWIQAVINTGTGEHVTSELGDPWTIGEYNQWFFDFFATFQLDIHKDGVSAGSEFGGFTYKQQTWRNGQYVDFPANADVDAYPDKSELGYSASISKDAIFLKVQYNALENTFYNITEWGGDTPALYYWYKTANKLITYSTTNSQGGVEEAWGEKGNCAEYTIVKATEIPMKMTSGNDGKYYATVYCPNALTLPDDVVAYRLNNVTETELVLKAIELTDNVLPAGTPVVLISDTEVSAGNWTISTVSLPAVAGTNLFKGVFVDTPNPGSVLGLGSNIYVLSNKEDIGFYSYSGAKIPAFRAYYESASPSPGNARKFLFGFDDESTAIMQLENDEAVEADNAVIYDLMGRRVTSLRKGGLYIVNNKKILVR